MKKHDGKPHHRIMETPSEYDIWDELIDWPAPFIPNLCDVLAVAQGPTGLLVTVYRKDGIPASDWIIKEIRQQQFKEYQLRFDDDDWEFYDECGKATGPFSCLLETHATESTTAVAVDCSAFLSETCELIGDQGLALLARVEAHAGASAADHANFRILVRRMIHDACAADLEHIYLINSRKWPCQVTGLFADVARLTARMQNVFLDRVKWLQNSWPLAEREFREIFAERLVQLRHGYVGALLRDCSRAAGMAEERITAMLAKWALASSDPKHRFALHIVETLREGLVFQKNTAEPFSPEVVQHLGAFVVKDYKKRLTMSLR